MKHCTIAKLVIVAMIWVAYGWMWLTGDVVPDKGALLMVILSAYLLVPDVK